MSNVFATFLILGRSESLEALARDLVPAQLAPDASPTPPPVLPETSRLKTQREMVVEGRTVTFQRLEGPPASTAAPKPQPTLPLPPAPLTVVSSKKHVVLFISGTVYDHALSELRWVRNGQEYRVFVNFDFTLFRGKGRFESEDTVYSLVLGVGERSWDQALLAERKLEESRGPLDASLKLPPLSFVTSPELRVFTPDPDALDIIKTPEYRAMPHLLNFYAMNEHDLRWSQALLKAENEARQRWREAHPAPPRGNATIQFWPSKSRTNQPAAK